MNLINLRRIIHFGLINFWRNRWLSLAAILVLSLTLITVTFSVVQNIDIQRAINSVKGLLSINVFFDDNVPETEIKDLQLKLQSRTDVKSVVYINKDQAFKDFQIFSYSEIAKRLVTRESNPLPRSLKINTDMLESQDDIAAIFKSPRYQGKIRSVSFEENKKSIEKFISQNKQVKKTGLVSSLAFVAISLVVLINTIRTMLTSRREEIEIMRLVGASNMFISGPFLIEILLMALIATVLSTGFLAASILFKLSIIPTFISTYLGVSSVGSDINQLIIQNIFTIFSLQLAFAFGLTFLTTFISLRRYLKS